MLLLLALLSPTGIAIASSFNTLEQPNWKPVVASEKRLLLVRDSLVRLMVVVEVSTRNSQAGDHFELRVHEPVIVDGRILIPVGTKAWGEVVESEPSASTGQPGRLAAKLSHIEIGLNRIPLSGNREHAGERAATQMAIGMIALGPFALLAKGNNARLRAGELFSGYVDANAWFSADGSLISISTVDQ